MHWGMGLGRRRRGELKYNERGKSRIEVSDILNYFKDIDSYYNDCTRYDTLKRMLEDIVAETKEDAERKTGKWVHGKELSREMIGDCVTAITYDGWKCSECGCLVEEEREPLYKYCPNCGTRMEGQDEN